jgi:hypothetical protein
VYSSILTEKKKSINPLTNLKIEIVKKLSSVFNAIFSPILKQTTKAISRAVKIQLVFDAIILVGIASIIFLMLKILKNQNVQTESLLLTEAINFNSIAGTVAKILGTTAGFILLVDGILYNIAFYKGYFKDSLDTSVVGVSSVIKLLQDLIAKEKKNAAGNDKVLYRLFPLEDQLDRLDSNFEVVIEKASSLKVKYSSSNAVVRFFKVYGAVIKELGWKRFFEILATPIILATMPLRIELPVAYENVKAKITKYKEERKLGSKFTLELAVIRGFKRDLSDWIYIYNGKEVTDEHEKVELSMRIEKDFPTKRDIVHSDYLSIGKNKNRVYISTHAEVTKLNYDFIVYNVFIFKIDKLDMAGVEDIISTIKSYADKYKRRIMEEPKTLSIIKSTLMKIYKIKGE